MAKVCFPTRAMPFASVLWNSELVDFREFVAELCLKLGREEIFEIPALTMEDYYADELMGSSSLLNKGQIKRRLVFFSTKTCSRSYLIHLKHFCDRLEKKAAKASSSLRPLNLDPGLLCLEQVYLSTFKPYAHRIFLGDGVYADLTYTYQKQLYQALPWTYPDYQSKKMIAIFCKMRKKLLKLKDSTGIPGPLIFPVTSEKVPGN